MGHKHRKRGRHAEDETGGSGKRRRVHDDADLASKPDADADPGRVNAADFIPLDPSAPFPADGPDGPDGPEREFFGMLTDEEHSHFKFADEMLASNFASGEAELFATEEQRQAFRDRTWEDAMAVALKLACSQSHSRFVERLVQTATPAQRKELFGAFADHFLTLIQHRFASHCCEMLFLRAAPLVTEELGRFGVDGEAKEPDGKADEKGEKSMEELFLLTLDELEGHLGYLMTDTYGSHSLRLLVLILSGNPLGGSETNSLLRSKRKEHTTVDAAAPGPASGRGTQENQHRQQREADLLMQPRTVPPSFREAVRKIIVDTTSTLGGSGLRALMESATGNPILQLLLELDMEINSKTKSKRKGNDSEKRKEEDAKTETLLERILPGAPESLSDAASAASEFVNSAMYSQTGSRILEVIIAHCAEPTFKALQENFFKPRMATYLKNDIASFCVVRALKRYSKEDLLEAVDSAVVPSMPLLVERGRFNVVKALIERCAALGAAEQLASLTTALSEACGVEDGALARRLCLLDGEGDEDKKVPAQYRPNLAAMASHGAQLLSLMLTTTEGRPALTAQTSLLALSPDHLVRLATGSMASVTVLTTALATPAADPRSSFHRALVAKLLPRMGELADAQFGHNLVRAVIDVPTRDARRSVPFHFKQAIVAQLAGRASELEMSWMGRKVWRGWRGALWREAPERWGRWAREVDKGVEKEFVKKPWEVAQQGRGGYKAGQRNGKAPGPSFGRTNGHRQGNNHGPGPGKNAGGKPWETVNQNGGYGRDNATAS